MTINLSLNKTISVGRFDGKLLFRFSIGPPRLCNGESMMATNDDGHQNYLSSFSKIIQKC